MQTLEEYLISMDTKYELYYKNGKLTAIDLDTGDEFIAILDGKRVATNSFSEEIEEATNFEVFEIEGQLSVIDIDTGKIYSLTLEKL